MKDRESMEERIKPKKIDISLSKEDVKKAQKKKIAITIDRDILQDLKERAPGGNLSRYINHLLRIVLQEQMPLDIIPLSLVSIIEYILEEGDQEDNLIHFLGHLKNHLKE